MIFTVPTTCSRPVLSAFIYFSCLCLLDIKMFVLLFRFRNFLLNVFAKLGILKFYIHLFVRGEKW